MLRWPGRIAMLMLVLALLAALAVWLLLRGSLATLDGEQRLPGLTAPVNILRDSLGIVTIDAGSETDALRALGYVHAQERYFEMDLLRRAAAGELAELFGPSALESDRKHRVHRMRARLQVQFDAIAGDRQPHLQAYVEGVNSGLGALSVRPWPYLLLRQQPRAWTTLDTPLVGIAMYFDLQDSGNVRELALWRMRPHLPEPLFALLSHDGSRWDAPLLGDPRGDAKLPNADEVDLRKLPATTSHAPTALKNRPTPGSNNFAISGTLTRDGRAILADDMHLALRAPNIWFRVRLRYPDPNTPDAKVDVSGFSLPGLPMVVVGSNGRIAWGFTNSAGDYLDWKRDVLCTGASGDPIDCVQVQQTREVVQVAGAPPVTLDVAQTDWGPVLHTLPDGSALSLRWAAHLRDAINLGLGNFAQARSLEHALVLADETGIPTQNLVMADHLGRIAWRLLGPIASRRGSCASTHLVEGAQAPPPATTSTTTRDGNSDAQQMTQGGDCEPWAVNNGGRISLQSPTAKRLWSANNRLVDGEALRRMGDGGFSLGVRGQQIRDQLLAKQRFNEQSLLAIQLDDRALLLQPWWTLLTDEARRLRTPAITALAAAAQQWQGRASTDSVSYRIVRAWRFAVHERIIDGLTAPAQAALDADFEVPNFPQLEGVVWPLLQQRPAHLLSRRYRSWDALLEDAAIQVRDELSAQGPLAERTWGEHNTADICHPLARALPDFSRRWLCMPADPLPGDSHMPRVQNPAFGASERMVVSPGRERDGIAHMPGGQSGHPLSPYWGAGHADWVAGKPTPFLPGQTQHLLQLKP